MTCRFNPLDHPVIFDTPARVSEPYNWIGHVPFAFALTSLTQPRLIVELGTHSGNSYLAFCQAVARLRLDTHCVAVDTWQGDDHAGKYSEDVFTRLKSYHDVHYGHFSTLRRMLFDDAVHLAEDSSIDLLHIDGLHSYEAVRHDFVTWLPKMSERGLVLLHDTAIEDPAFGVGRLVDELSTRYPTLRFAHSCGLGVVYVGTVPMSAELASLFVNEDNNVLRTFEHLGQALDACVAVSTGAPVHIGELPSAVAAITRTVAAMADHRAELEREIAARSALCELRQEQAASLEAEIAVRDGIQIDQQSQIATLLGQHTELERHIAARDAQISELVASTSWRITRPLRAARRAWRAIPRAVVRVLRGTFNLLPLTPDFRRRLRNAILRRANVIFGRLPAYQAWRAREVGPATRLIPPCDARVVSSSTDRYGRMYASLFTRAAGVKGVDLEYVPLATDSLANAEFDLRLVAFYLPQFHPIPENDQWWGRGFTEWTNVSKAVPQFEGHYQPHLPAELGFYDLRVIDVMRRQVELARQYGVGAFCFHYYWFGGRRLLERPLDQYLAHPELDLPFCVCWANENWSRRWDGSENELLISQEHTPESDERFIADVSSMFSDARYLRVNGRAVLIVYRISLLPDPMATTTRWREHCRQKGLGEIYLVAAQSFEVSDPRPYGCDAAVEFPPHQVAVGTINDRVSLLNAGFDGKVYDYRDLAKGYCEKPEPDFVLHKTVVPSWDNEARRPGRGHCFHHATPESYAKWLSFVCRRTVERAQGDERLVFVNAWNEWAEGAHLEPDRRFGYAYLHATANVMRGHLVASPDVDRMLAASRDAFVQRSDIAMLVHLYYVDLLDDVVDAIEASGVRADVFLSVRPDVSIEELTRIRERLPHAYIVTLPNRGRDILPMLHLLPELLSRRYVAVCKLHGKKSLQLANGAQWRNDLYSALLDPSVAARVTARFRCDDSLGLMCPAWSRISLADPDRHVLNHWWLSSLLPRLGESNRIGAFDFDFVAGSMFWFRPQALAPLLSLNLKPEDFELELGQVDGTLAHAVERLSVLAVEKAGFTAGSTDERPLVRAA
ncbi:glycoside hydrolase family 99-like domain-containing protein [Uliginosibacterium sp. sgz301328]|uniref:glycoside hydrolase family 99-like domain-containing protein n=1 Tax=Uliginosibacterium sp. sgz301328 TaxID=3243764 RepID=UPI00359CECC6